MRWLVACGLLALVACGRGPEIKYYALPTLPQDTGDVGGLPVIVGPVRVPRLLDRPQLVTRVGASALEVDDLHRWATGLDMEVARALAENVGRLLPSAHVVVHPAGDPGGQAMRVAVDIERLDAIPGSGTHLRVRWVVRRGVAPDPLAIEAFSGSAPLASDTAEAVVASYGEVVTALSRAIADKLRTLPAEASPASASDVRP